MALEEAALALQQLLPHKHPQQPLDYLAVQYREQKARLDNMLAHLELQPEPPAAPLGLHGGCHSTACPMPTRGPPHPGGPRPPGLPPNDIDGDRPFDRPNGEPSPGGVACPIGRSSRHRVPPLWTVTAYPPEPPQPSVLSRKFV